MRVCEAINRFIKYEIHNNFCLRASGAKWGFVAN